MPRDNETARWIRNEADQLANAGYEEGDVIPIAAFEPFERTDNFTTTSFNSSAAFYRHSINVAKLFDSENTIVASMVGVADPGTDETVDVRFVNNRASETLVEILDTGNSFFESGWVEYTPGTFDQPAAYAIDRRTNPGVNQSTIREMTTYLGVKL